MSRSDGGPGNHDVADFETDRNSVPFDDLHLENIFDDNGVSGQLVDELLAMD